MRKLFSTRQHHSLPHDRPTAAPVGKKNIRRKSKKSSESSSSSSSYRGGGGGGGDPLTAHHHHIQNRISVVGAMGTGKTSLIYSYIRQRWHPDFDKSDDQTTIIGPNEDSDDEDDSTAETQETDQSDFAGGVAVNITNGQQQQQHNRQHRTSTGALSDMAVSVVSSEGDATTATSANSFVLAETVVASRLKRNASVAHGGVLSSSSKSGGSGSTRGSALQSPMDRSDDTAAAVAAHEHRRIDADSNHHQNYRMGSEEDDELDIIFRESQPPPPSSSASSELKKPYVSPTLSKLIKKSQQKQQQQRQLSPQLPPTSAENGESKEQYPELTSTSSISSPMEHRESNATSEPSELTMSDTVSDQQDRTRDAIDDDAQEAQKSLHVEVEALLEESKQLEKQISALEANENDTKEQANGSTESENDELHHLRSRLAHVRQQVRIKLPAYRVAMIQSDAATKRIMNNRLSRRDIEPSTMYDSLKTVDTLLLSPTDYHKRERVSPRERLIGGIGEEHGDVDEDATTVSLSEITDGSSTVDSSSTTDTNLQHLYQLQKQEQSTPQRAFNPRMSIVGLQSISYFGNTPDYKRALTPLSARGTSNMFPTSPIADDGVGQQAKAGDTDGIQQVISDPETTTAQIDQFNEQQEAQSLGNTSETTDSTSPSLPPLPSFEDYVKCLPSSYKLMEGIHRFNQDEGSCRKAIQYMVNNGVLENHPMIIARFLATTSSLKKSHVGDYLGRAQNEAVLVAYADFHNSTVLRKKSFIDAIRTFLSLFNLPAEGQMVTRIAEQFSLSYVRHHPEMEVRDGDTVTLLACALLMLNTDLHHPLVKNKMTREQFHIILEGRDIPPKFIDEMYDEIRDNPMLVEDDDEEDAEESYMHPLLNVEASTATSSTATTTLDLKKDKKKGILSTLKTKLKDKGGQDTSRMTHTPTTPSSSTPALEHDSTVDALPQQHRILYKTKAFINGGIHHFYIKDTDSPFDLRQHSENLGAMDDEIMKSDLFICTYSVSDLESFVMIQSLIDRILKLKVFREQKTRLVSPRHNSSSRRKSDAATLPHSNISSDRRSTSIARTQSSNPQTSRRRTMSFFGGARRRSVTDETELSGSGLLSCSSSGTDNTPISDRDMMDAVDDSIFGEGDSTATIIDNILLCALHIDVPEDQRAVSFQDGANYALKKGIPFFEVSTVLNKNVCELFTMAFESLLEMQHKAENKKLSHQSVSSKKRDRKKKKKDVTLDELISMPKTYI